VQQSQYFINERFGLSRLVHYEMPPTLLRDLDERIASHVLHTLVRLMHELEQFVHNRLQEFPVSFQESGILTDNVHDVGSYDSLVVLSAFDFAQSEQVFDDRYQEALLCIFVWKQR